MGPSRLRCPLPRDGMVLRSLLLSFTVIGPVALSQPSNLHRRLNHPIARVEVQLQTKCRVKGLDVFSTITDKRFFPLKHMFHKSPSYIHVPVPPPILKACLRIG